MGKLLDMAKAKQEENNKTKKEKKLFQNRL